MDTERQNTVVMAAVRRILRPLLKLLLANGITFPAINELLKQVLVEVAEKDFPVAGKAVNDSRVSVLTGLHRKDVKRLRHGPVVVEDVPKSVSLGSQLVNAWLTESAWLEADGSPRVLEKLLSDEGGASFEALAESVSKDVRPRAILDELLRLGAVTLIDGKRVQLNTEAFVPNAGIEEKLYYLQRAGYAHLMASVHNVEGEQPAFFDRIVHYDSIPAEALPALRKLAEKEGSVFLRKLNVAAHKASDKQGKDVQAFTLGSFMFAEPLEISTRPADKDS